MGAFITEELALPAQRTNAPGLGTASQTYQVDAGFLNFILNALDAVREHGRGTFNISSYGAVADGTDQTERIQEAIDAAAEAGGGTVTVPHGEFLCGELQLYSTVGLKGLGWGSCLKQLSDAQWLVSVHPGEGNDADMSENQTNIMIRDLQLRGTCDVDGFSEHTHIVNLNGVSDGLVENCLVKGFRGDGIYVGSGNGEGSERHNQRITIRKCKFDGVNKANRNAISVIDCDGITIEDNFFTNCTASNMPGAVDFEPNLESASAVIRNATVKNNKFYDVGGNVAAIAVYLPRSQANLTVPAQNIVIEGNHIDTCTFGGIAVMQVQDASTSTIPQIVRVTGNTVKNTTRMPLFLRGIRDAIVESNHFLDSADTVMIGTSIASAACMDIKFLDNTLDKLGATTGIGLYVYDVSRTDIEGNTFIDCGKSDLSIGYAIDFHGKSGGVTSSYIKLLRNTISSPLGRTTWAIQKESNHTFTASTNVKGQNVLIGVTGDAFTADSNAEAVVIRNTQYDTTKLPDSFGIGEEISSVNGDTALPGQYKQGVLRTVRTTSISSAWRKYMTQWYTPANNATVYGDLGVLWIRVAEDATNTWSPWRKVYGSPDARVHTTTPVTFAAGEDMAVIRLASPGAVAVTLPASPNYGDRYLVKDGLGDASTNPITITPNATPGGQTIDGAATYVIDKNWGEVELQYIGTNSIHWAVTRGRGPTQGTYTPTWTGAVTNPVLGNGNLTAMYTRVGKQVTVTINLVMGGTTTYGSGRWSFSLPFTAATGQFMASAWIQDASTSNRYLVAGYNLTTTTMSFLMNGGTTTSVDASNPMAWASGDYLFTTFTYVCV
jgi:polygalacturonase